MGARLTPTEVAARLEEAFATLRLVPDDDLRHLARQKPRATWPGYVRTVQEAYGYNGDPQRRYGPKERESWDRKPDATPEQIGRMNEALSWLVWLSERDRKIVAGKALGVSFRWLRKELAADHHNQIKLWYLGALCYVAGRLDGGNLEN